MKTIKYQIKISGVNEKQQNVCIEIYSSNAEELIKDIQAILEKDRPTWVERVLGLVR